MDPLKDILPFDRFGRHAKAIILPVFMSSGRYTLFKRCAGFSHVSRVLGGFSGLGLHVLERVQDGWNVYMECQENTIFGNSVIVCSHSRGLSSAIHPPNTQNQRWSQHKK